jgi:endonuclease YncB( thermonuclease family)
LRFPVRSGDDVPMLRRLLASVLLAVAAPGAQATDDRPVLDGVVVGIVDGDTADVRLASGMIRVRFHAIDAPERDQPYGAASKAALAALVYGKPVALEPIEQDRYDRLVARLWLGELDVNAEMVRQGHAWVYRRYDDDPAYCAYEKAARDQRRGLWALPPSQRPAPWEWRRRKSLAGGYTDYSAQAVAECVASLGR